MSRAFVKENDLEHAGIDVPERPISSEKNYVTPNGLMEIEEKISDLEELTLIHVDSWQISEKGRRFKVYRSRIKDAEISIKKPEASLTLTPNDNK